MRRRALSALIFGAWLLCMAWLVCYEAFPGFFTHTAQGYRSLFSDGLLIDDRWMKISFNDVQIGYSHTSVDVHEDATIDQYVINNHTVMNPTIMGAVQHIRLRARATLDAMYNLQDFTFTMGTRDYSLAVNGTRAGDEQFDVKVRTGGSTQTFSVDIPRDAVLYSPMVEMALQKLQPGEQMHVQAFNPVSLDTEDILVRALRREVLVREGLEVDATVLEADVHGMQTLTWIDEEGRVIRQETPFGWTLEACTADEALAPAPNGAQAGDLLLAMAVPVRGIVNRPRARATLRVRLEGASLQESSLQTHRQDVERFGADTVDLLLRRETLPAGATELGSHDPELAPYLAASPYLQVEDPAIVARAHRIVGNERNSVKAAVSIFEWVHANMKREPSPGIPSAVDVLQKMTGDCNEHTYLFVALARAAGIPAKITVGIVYNDGAFFYHAWPAVHVGRWLEMDPTLGQIGVDATHIRLLEGGIADQMALMGMIGRLRAHVLDEQATAAP